MLLKRFLAPLAAVTVLATPLSLYAQGAPWRMPSASERYRGSTDAQVSYPEARRTAYEEGYRRGIREGEKDARQGDRFSYHDEREFQRADRGYHRSFGDRERYRQVFRDGYATGYSDGFGRLARSNRNYGPYQNGPRPNAQRGPYAYGGTIDNRYPRSGYYGQAFDNGARDGFEKGREDARKNRSFDPVRHSWYREGDRHYENRYGSRQEYKNVYRQGFQQGYEQGFRDGRYR